MEGDREEIPISVTVLHTDLRIPQEEEQPASVVAPEESPKKKVQKTPRAVKVSKKEEDPQLPTETELLSQNLSKFQMAVANSHCELALRIAELEKDSLVNAFGFFGILFGYWTFSNLARLML
jgi:hypothetical protein